MAMSKGGVLRGCFGIVKWDGIGAIHIVITIGYFGGVLQWYDGVHGDLILIGRELILNGGN